AAIHHAAADPRLPDCLVDVRIVVPDFFAGAGVHRVHHAPRRDAIDDAVRDQWRALLAILRIATRRRDIYVVAKSQAVYIPCVDLVERAIALLGPTQVVADPLVAGSGGIA